MMKIDQNGPVRRGALIFFALLLSAMFFGALWAEENAPLVHDGVADWSALTQDASGTAENPAQIDIPQGVYRLDAEKATVETVCLSNSAPVNPKKIGLILRGLKNAVIDFHDSELQLRGALMTMLVEDCENVTLKNFRIDSPSPVMVQAEILQNDENGIVIQPASWCPAEVENNQLVFVGDGWRSAATMGMVYDPKTKHVLTGVPDMFANFDGASVANGRVTCPNWKEARFPVGTVVVLRPETFHLTGIFLHRCRNMTLENIKIHYAPAKAIIAQRCENLHFKGVSISLREGLDDPRFFTANADAIHCSCCKGKITVEEGVFESMMDDAINVHGIYVKATKKIDDFTMEVQFMQPGAWGFDWAVPGDVVRFLNAPRMEHFGEQVTVASVRPVDQPTIYMAKRFELTFREPIPAAVTFDETTALENLSQTAEVVYRNNVIRNNRARGCLFETVKPVLVEGNTFDHVAGTALLFCGDASGWYESGPCENVVVRKNRFVNCMTSIYQFCRAIISIYPEIADFASQCKFYNGGSEGAFLIEENTFETFDLPILYARSTDGITFRKNCVTHNSDFAKIAADTKPFTFEMVNRVRIYGNRFDNGFNGLGDVSASRSPTGAIRFDAEEPFGPSAPGIADGTTLDAACCEK